jgi:hypothetical protein
MDGVLLAAMDRGMDEMIPGETALEKAVKP